MSRRDTVGANRPVLRSRREMLENLSPRTQRAQDRQMQVPEPDPEPQQSDANESLENMDMFVLTSSQENPGETIDYSSSEGLKLCNADTEELPMKFYCDSKNVVTFCKN